MFPAAAFLTGLVCCAPLGLQTGCSGCSDNGREIKAVEVTPSSPTIARGTTQQLAATVVYTDNTTEDVTSQASWSSSDTSVATVSEAAGSEGLATALAKGNTTISATFSGVEGTTELTVTDASLVSIEITPTSPKVARGTTQQFQATGTFSDSSTQDLTTQVSWSSSDTAVATISDAAGSEGLATAIDKGTTTIKAALSGVEGSTELTVTDATMVSIEITPTNPQVAMGTTQQLTATGTFSDSSTQDLTTQVSWSSSDTAVATISDDAGSKGLATALAKGATTIKAALSGVEGSTLLTVTDATLLSIEITPASPSLAKGTTLQLTATGIYSDSTTQDLTTQVAWSSSDPSVATVSNAAGSEGLATALAKGTTTVKASLSGIEGSTTLTVTDATLLSIEITPASPLLAKGTTLQLTATGTYSDSTTQDLTQQVSWSSSDTAVASVSSAAGSEGLATALVKGTTTVKASLSGIEGSTTLTVTDATLVSIEVTPTNPSLAKGTTLQLTATGTYSDSTTQDLTQQVSWSSSDTAVATVSSAAGSEGLATALAKGTTTVKAILSEVEGSTLLTVTDAALQSIAVTPTNPSLAKGTTLQLTATGTYSDSTTQDLTQQVSWSSSAAAVATISNAAGSEGLATALVKGTSTIKASLSGIEGSTLLTVTDAVLQSVAVTPTNPSIANSTTQSFKATATYTDSTTQDVTLQVTWSSSNTAVATISNASGSKGLASAVGPGTTTITAAFSGHSGSSTLTVTSATLSSIAITPSNPSVPKGGTRQFTATGTFSDSTTQDLTQLATWASSDTAVATISNTAGSRGLASAVNAGSATIQASFLGKIGTTTIAVTPATLVSITVSPSNPSATKGTTVQLSATGTYSDSTTQDLTAVATWSSSNTAVATVSNAAGSEGLVNALNTGTATVSATYLGKSGGTTLTVTAATLTGITVTPVNPSAAKGTYLQLTATGSYSDSTTQDVTSQVTWSSSDTGVATVSNASGSKGLAFAVGLGSTTVSATLAGQSDSTTLTVTSATLANIAVTPTNPVAATGTTLQLAATGTYSDSTTQDLTGQVTWSSSDASVAIVSNASGSKGLVTTQAPGSATLTATFGGKSGATVVTVTPATLTAIDVTPTNPSIAKGTEQQFTATGLFSDNTTQDITSQVSWSSSNTAVAAISNVAGSEGLATGVDIGTVTVSASLFGVTGTTQLQVTAAVLVSIAVTPASPSIAKGTTQQLTATGTYSDSTTQDLTNQVSWSSSSTTVATISNSPGSQGLAFGAAVGSSTISATLGGTAGTTLLTVTPATLDSITITPVNPTLPKGMKLQFTATGTYSDSTTQDLTTQVTWSSSATTVATVSNTAGSRGLATAVDLGTTTIAATMSGVTATTLLTVTPATLTSIAVTPTNPQIANGTTQQFTAIATYSDSSTQDITTQVTWGSSNPAVAKVSNASGSKGLASAVGLGTTTVLAIMSGVSGTASLIVTSATLSTITVTPAAPSIANGTTQQFKATGKYSDNSTQDITTQVSWSSSDSVVATISNAAGSEGLASALSKGSTTITATMSGISGTTVLTVTDVSLISITVTPANPQLAKGATLQLTATGTFSDSSTQDITTLVVWGSSAPAVATVSNASGSEGLATAVDPGAATISATMSGLFGSTLLTVSTP